MGDSRVVRIRIISRYTTHTHTHTVNRMGEIMMSNKFNLGSLNSKNIVRVDENELFKIYSRDFVMNFNDALDTGYNHDRTDILNTFKMLLEDEISDSGEVEFGKSYHANGIGNNCQIPIEYVNDNNVYKLGYINMNHDMYGSYLVYLENELEESLHDYFQVRAK